MKLKQACEIAEVCGIDTIGRAILNIEIHWITFFTFENYAEEFNELYKEAEKYNMDDPISVVLKGENENERI